MQAAVVHLARQPPGLSLCTIPGTCSEQGVRFTEVSVGNNLDRHWLALFGSSAVVWRSSIALRHSFPAGAVCPAFACVLARPESTNISPNRALAYARSSRA